MPLYLVPRTRAWLSEEEVAAAADCVPAVNETIAGIRWIRSYVVEEDDGSLGTVCIYESTTPEAIRQHAGNTGMSADEITKVADTVIVREDPVHV